jgi:hypothetical protein
MRIRNFNTHADHHTRYFRDYDYLKGRIGYDAARHNILAVTERPTQVPAPIEGFAFCGLKAILRG